ncbi:MAG: cation-binding protein [Deltaproteobacteria bacterium]|nr:cation-binding protein [Deltaproteobacteria bacterium]
MKPIGPLMWEHRLIEKMAGLFIREINRIKEENIVNTVFISAAVDFFRTYADRTHHGKEEDILFRDLQKKNLSPDHDRTMRELVEEHIFARKTVGRLLEANGKYLGGDKNSITDVISCLRELSELYPKHIEKEDKHFFFPILDYFTAEEQAAMLKEFWEFDKNMIHEKYRKVVEEFSKT